MNQVFGIINTVVIAWVAYRYGRIRGRADLYKELEPAVEKIVDETKQFRKIRNKGVKS